MSNKLKNNRLLLDREISNPAQGLKKKSQPSKKNPIINQAYPLRPNLQNNEINATSKTISKNLNLNKNLINSQKPNILSKEDNTNIKDQMQISISIKEEKNEDQEQNTQNKREIIEIKEVSNNEEESKDDKNLESPNKEEEIQDDKKIISEMEVENFEGTENNIIREDNLTEMAKKNDLISLEEVQDSNMEKIEDENENEVIGSDESLEKDDASDDSQEKIEDKINQMELINPTNDDNLENNNIVSVDEDTKKVEPIIKNEPQTHSNKTKSLKSNDKSSPQSNKNSIKSNKLVNDSVPLENNNSNLLKDSQIQTDIDPLIQTEIKKYKEKLVKEFNIKKQKLSLIIQNLNDEIESLKAKKDIELKNKQLELEEKKDKLKEMTLVNKKIGKFLEDYTKKSTDIFSKLTFLHNNKVKFKSESVGHIDKDKITNADKETTTLFITKEKKLQNDTAQILKMSKNNSNIQSDLDDSCEFLSKMKLLNLLKYKDQVIDSKNEEIEMLKKENNLKNCYEVQYKEYQDKISSLKNKIKSNKTDLQNYKNEYKKLTNSCNICFGRYSNNNINTNLTNAKTENNSKSILPNLLDSKENKNLSSSIANNTKSKIYITSTMNDNYNCMDKIKFNLNNISDSNTSTTNQNKILHNSKSQQLTIKNVSDYINKQKYYHLFDEEDKQKFTEVFGDKNKLDSFQSKIKNIEESRIVSENINKNELFKMNCLLNQKNDEVNKLLVAQKEKEKKEKLNNIYKSKITKNYKINKKIIEPNKNNNNQFMQDLLNEIKSLNNVLNQNQKIKDKLIKCDVIKENKNDEENSSRESITLRNRKTDDIIKTDEKK